MPEDAVLPIDMRPLAYRWLSGLFADAPVQKTLEGFADAAGRTLMNALADKPAFRPLIDAVRGVSPDATERQIRAVDLAVSYGRLFQGAAGAASPRPVQSAYVSRIPNESVAPADKMASLLRDLGLPLEQTANAPPDHIAVQLSVMAELAARYAHAWSEGMQADGQALRQRQIGFIDGHLLCWLPAYRADCKAVDDVGFYATALGVAESFLKGDRTWLESRSA